MYNIKSKQESKQNKKKSCLKSTNLDVGGQAY